MTDPNLAKRHRLVKLLGFRATLVHGDTTTRDRWKWLLPRLPKTQNSESLLDVGCGAGSFTIGAALRGYQSTGISWDRTNNDLASERAELSGAKSAKFVVGDVGQLGTLTAIEAQYDLVICLECIEHIVDDAKLMVEMALRLKPGGRLLLTTPNYYAPGIDKHDEGPFILGNHGWHVRRGYTPAMLVELCRVAGLSVDEISYCTGPLSRSATRIWRWLAGRVRRPTLAWLVFLPVRLALLPLRLFDVCWVSKNRFLGTSICLEASKPRIKS